MSTLYTEVKLAIATERARDLLGDDAVRSRAPQAASFHFPDAKVDGVLCSPFGSAELLRRLTDMMASERPNKRRRGPSPEAEVASNVTVLDGGDVL